MGRGGARVAHSLDNRTTKIKVTGVPPAAHENVKAHLMVSWSLYIAVNCDADTSFNSKQFGEVITAEFKDNEDFGVVHFKNRWEAEKVCAACISTCR